MALRSQSDKIFFLCKITVSPLLDEQHTATNWTEYSFFVESSPHFRVKQIWLQWARALGADLSMGTGFVGWLGGNGWFGGNGEQVPGVPLPPAPCNCPARHGVEFSILVQLWSLARPTQWSIRASLNSTSSPCMCVWVVRMGCVLCGCVRVERCHV